MLRPLDEVLRVARVLRLLDEELLLLEGLLTWLDFELVLRVALVERLLDEVLRLLDLVLVWVEVPRLLV